MEVIKDDNLFIIDDNLFIIAIMNSFTYYLLQRAAERGVW